MKEFVNIFHSDFFKTIVIYLLPGGFFIYPWYRTLILLHPELRQLFASSELSRSGLLICLSVVAGMLFENFGSRYEKRLDNKYNSTDEDDSCCWDRYLRTVFVGEPVGCGYIRTLVMRMKLELNLGFSLFFAWPTIWFGYYSLPNASACFATLVTVCILSLSIYLLACEAPLTHKVLIDARKNICDKDLIVRGQQVGKDS